MSISLISNTGIQFYKTHIQFNWNQFRTAFHFHEFVNEGRMELEVAQQTVDQMGNYIYLAKDDLKKHGLLDRADRLVGTWNGIANINPISADKIIEASPATLKRGLFGDQTPLVSKFFGQWLPFPCFGNKGSEAGPYNWVRMMIVPQNYTSANVKNYVNGIQDWQIVLAFDTKAVFDDGNYNEEFREIPLFANRFEASKEFGFPVSDLKLMNFVAPSNGNKEWIDTGIMKLVHNTIDINAVFRMAKNYVRANHDGFGPLPHIFVYDYLANYIYLLHVVATKLADVGETVTLVNDLKTTPINVDLVVDMGNSKTTAVLFENGCFDKVAMLELQDFTHPDQTERSPFDMNVVFDKVNFGVCNIENSKQFVYPSLVRLGREATYLRYQAGIDEECGRNQSTCSSPKRYLWDKHPSPFEWQNIPHGNGAPSPIKLDGITNQFNGDGTLVTDKVTLREKCYSRRSLMTFAFLEILAQASRHINNVEFRRKHGFPDQPRRIAKIIVTCPTAMSRQEQIELRTAASEAFVVLDRYNKSTDRQPLAYAQAINAVPVIPSLRSLRNANMDGQRAWVYDEATCVQFVFLCAEIAKRYSNNCDAFVEVYGKKRDDVFVEDERGNRVPYPEKTLTIGSVDIGAGTTDVMICSYKYEIAGQTTLTPVPKYWESFYKAGDDIMNEFVHKIVIEDGPSSVRTYLENTLGKSKGKDGEASQLIADFFGPNTNHMSFATRQFRKEFCQQVSVPIAQRYMELISNEVDSRDLSWDEIFDGDNKPNKVVLDRFEKHFGYRIEQQKWHYDMKEATEMINHVMEELVKTISKFLSDYECDIVILAGRPCSLKPIVDLFVKYSPVLPTKNRFKVLKDYRVGEWYPFQGKRGYFEDQKSIVAVGALLGYICSERGGFDGKLSINLDELCQLMQPTTNYIGMMGENATPNMPDNKIILTPTEDQGDCFVPSLPIRLGCRQFKSESYPARPLFNLELDEKAIRNSVVAYLKNNGLDENDELNIERICSTRRRRYSNLTLTFERDYDRDREGVRIANVVGSNGSPVERGCLSLQIKSLNESDAFWMDNGAFEINL